MFCQELARQLRRDVIPKLDAAGIKLFFISIGPPERGLEFCELTGLPTDRMLADPGNILYDAIGFRKGVSTTLFSIQTPISILQRLMDGRFSDLAEATSTWKTWIPPKMEQTFQQGGAMIFKGQDCLLIHYDKATGAHIDLSFLMQSVLEGN